MVVRCPVCDHPNDADFEHCQKCSARIPMGLREQAIVHKRQAERRKREYADGDVAHRDARREAVRRTSADSVERRQNIQNLRGEIQYQDTGISAWSPSDRYAPPPQHNTAARSSSGRAFVDTDRYRQQSGGQRQAASGPRYTDQNAWHEAQRNDLRDGRPQAGFAEAVAGHGDEHAAAARLEHAPSGGVGHSGVRQSHGAPAQAQGSGGNAPSWGGLGAHQVSSADEGETARALASSGFSDPMATLDAAAGAAGGAAIAGAAAWSPPGGTGSVSRGAGSPAGEMPPPPRRSAGGRGDMPPPPGGPAAPAFVQRGEMPAGRVARGGDGDMPPPPSRARQSMPLPPTSGELPTASSGGYETVARNQRARGDGGEAPRAPTSADDSQAPIVEPAPRVRARNTGEVWLIFLDEEGGERDKLPLRIGKTIIGRTEGEVLLRKDPFVSPWHAQLTVRRNGVTIKDMYSLNGIFRKISRQSQLRDHDRFAVGRQVIRFREGWTEAEPDAQGTRPLGGPRPATEARVLVLTDSNEIADQRVIRETLSIGRAGCDLSIPEDDMLEDKHAQIQWDGSGFILIDLNSHDGIFLAIREETELHDGDVVQIGMQRMLLRC